LLLEPVEHALDAIAVFVGSKVAGDGLFAVRLWRDDRNNALEQQAASNVVAVISLSANISFGLATGSSISRSTAW